MPDSRPLGHCGDSLLTPTEAAKVLGLATRSLYEMARRGEIPSIRLGPKTWRFHGEDLRARPLAVVARERERPPMKKKGRSTPFRHGTYNGYNNRGCRCGACRKAWADYTSKRRRKQKAYNEDIRSEARATNTPVEEIRARREVLAKRERIRRRIRSAEQRERRQSDTSGVREIKSAINLALDSIEGAAMHLADRLAGRRIDLTDRLGKLSGELEQLKAEVWEALDA